MPLTIHPELRRNPHLLAAAALGLSVGMLSSLFYSMGTFMPVWKAEFGWSRGDMSLSLTFATVAMFLCGTMVGRLASGDVRPWGLGMPGGSAGLAGVSGRAPKSQ